MLDFELKELIKESQDFDRDKLNQGCQSRRSLPSKHPHKVSNSPGLRGLAMQKVRAKNFKTSHQNDRVSLDK